MTEYNVGTREDWQAARDELAKLEAEHAELTQKVTEKRRQLPWVPVEKEYEFDTEDGKKTLAELFEGRSQLLAYNIMYGPDYSSARVPAARAWATSSTGRGSTWITKTSRSSRSRARRLTDWPPTSSEWGGSSPTSRPRDRLPVRLRARADPGTGHGDPAGPGDPPRPAPVPQRRGRSRSARSSRTDFARRPVGSPSRARTGPSTTPTP